MNTIFVFNLDLSKNPLLVRVECPTILHVPIELSIEYELNKQYSLSLTTNIFYVPMEYKFMLQKDLKVIEVTLKTYGMDIIDIKGTGDVKMGKYLPELIKYEVAYKLVQGWVAEGKIDVDIDLMAVEKVAHVAVHTTILPVVAVEIRCHMKPNYSAGLAHSVLIGNEIVYTMEHKNIITLKNGKWVAIHTDKFTIPTTSMVQRVFGSTYFGKMILNFERMTTVEIDLETPTIFFYNFKVENAILMSGAK